MKDKLIKLIKKEIETREEIPYGNGFLSIKFEDGEPPIKVMWDWSNKAIVKFCCFGLISYTKESSEVILVIHCGREKHYLTEEETKDLEKFVEEQDRIKTENKIDKRLKIHESKN